MLHLDSLEHHSLVACSTGIVRTVGLAELLGAPIQVSAQRLDKVVYLGWGAKRSGQAAQQAAQRHERPFLLLEDGFLRSVELGFRSHPFSVVLDDLGVYYDARRPSRLERLIQRPLTAAEHDRADALMAIWRDGRLSKYNHAPEDPSARALAADAVLVVDQTAGDASVRYGMADARSFARMLEAALDEHPTARILLKTHPDVLAGHKKGNFDRLTPGIARRVTVVATDTHPPCLLEQAAAVYVVSSQMGFEGLIWNKPVRCFGMPFYGGWGVTRDELPPPERRRPASLQAIVHAALVEYPRYLDPETQQRCEPERLMQWMALQRRMRTRLGNAPIHLIGFSRWKKPIARMFLAGCDVHFHRTPRTVPTQARVAIWGRKPMPANAGPGSLRLEDGFLRSVGLGADLIRPVSWVTDGRGIYFDATGPSDLEHLLEHRRFDAATLARAQRLRERIVGERLSKYNSGRGSWQRPAGTRRVVLVPGQVEDDASIVYGAPGIRTNLGLLMAVRKAEPDAYVLYKPHPDVVAGLRKRGSHEDEAARHCDEVVGDVAIADLLDVVDDVHVLTSLTGFEALLRGRRVVTYGLPFYAGWGLTEDRLRCERRTRRLPLDELVAGALIEYPVYVSRVTGHYTTPERALTELALWRTLGQSTMPLWRKGLRWFLRLAKNAPAVLRRI